MRVIPGLALGLLAGCGLAGAAHAADADLQATVQELLLQVQALQQRVGDLEAQLAAERDRSREAVSDAAPAPVTVSAPTPATGSGPLPPTASGTVAAAPQGASGWTVPGLGAGVQVGGRVKLDGLYNSTSVGGPGGRNSADLALVPGAIPVGIAGQDDQLSFNARESRLWVKSLLPTAYGDLGAYLEIDFSAAQSPGDERVSHSHTPRLRHGYARFGPLTAGQTWTTFMNPAVFPETNDANGPVGMLNVRQPLLRWTHALDSAELHLALESPETTLTGPDGARVAPDDDRWPDLVARLDLHGDWGEASLSGLARELRSDGALSPGVKDSAWGGALSVAGRIPTRGRDNLRFSLAHGNALGRYTSLNAFNAGFIDADGRIRLTPVTSALLGYQHWWSPRWRSNVAASVAFADLDRRRLPAGVTEWVESYHANLLWSPVLQASLGLEYIYARRELLGGASGDLHRLQFSALYNF